MTNHVPPSSKEMLLHSISKKHTKPHRCFPIFLFLISKNTTGILERITTNKALHIISGKYIMF